MLRLRRLLHGCLLVTLLPALILGCGEATEVPASGTDQMRAELAAIHADAEAHPMRFFHMNRARAEVWRERLEQASGRQQLQIAYSYASELLNGGETRAALTVLQDLIRASGGSSVGAIPERLKPLYELLAIAYLRLGEQENCLEEHNPESCILPLQGKGIHTRTSGSRQAIRVYERLLATYPDDLQSRWLLNIAYMTLDDYPDGVPEAYRMDGLLDDAGVDLPRFANRAMDLGLGVNHLSGGLCVEDFNGDGLLDLFMTSYGLNDPMYLFLADGEGGYTDYTEEAGLTGLVSGLNAVQADYDNDGDIDILVLRGAWLGTEGAHPNSLLRNNGDATFTEAIYEAGLASHHPTQTAAWADVNRDGWLDLFIGNESNAAFQQVLNPSETAPTPHPSELYLNNQNGTFTEVSDAFGLEVDAFVKGVAWGDVNNDQWPDLYVSVVGGPNHLYVNRPGTADSLRTFENIAPAAGVEAPVFSFPAWFWDYDNDGLQDLYVLSYDVRDFGQTPVAVAAEYVDASVSHEGPRLYRNNGDETFTDVTEATGMNRALYGMGSNFGDLNNDGWLDAYVGTGAPDLRALIPNRMFLNSGGTQFDEVTYSGGFGHLQKGHAVAFADFDQDGDQDIYAVMGGAIEGDVFPNALFENPGTDPDHAWVTLYLEGTTANRSALGARVQLVTRHPDGSRRTLYRTVSTGGSFGANPLRLSVGLDDATRIASLTILWPDPEGTTDTYYDLEVNQHLRVVQGADTPDVLDRPPVPFRSGVDTSQTM